VVSDAEGALAGATVKLKGSNKATVTDATGHFSIEAGAQDVLEVSFLGYATKEVPIAGRTHFEIFLEGSAQALDEVVVVGYGTMRKSDFTGSLASVKASELSLTTSTFGQALVGKIAGVQVSQPNGAPGEGVKIRVRGIGSLSASTAPLYVIDGYPASEDVYINPEDIETVDVLKDAASAAIYGSRGAGGVVLITTKRGNDKKVRIDYDYQYSIAQLERKIQMLDAYQFRDLVIEARNNSYKDKAEAAGKPWNPLDDNAARSANGFSLSEVGIADIFFDFTTGKPVEPAYNTDWQDAIYSSVPAQRHNLAVTGGSEALKYRLSFGYLDQDGIIAPSNHNRINVRANVDANVTKRFKVGANFSFSDVNERQVQANGRFINDGIVQTALMSYPQFPVYNPDGSYAVGNQIAMKADGYAQVENPVALAHEIDIRERESRTNFNTNLSFDITEQLFIQANLGAQYTTRRYNYYRPRTVGQDGDMPNSSGAIARVLATDITNYDVDKLGEFTLNYKNEWGNHRINGVAGYTLQKKTYDRVGVDAKGFSDDRIHEITAHGPEPSDVSLHGSDTRKAAWTMMSYLGRVNYAYDNRYTVSGTLRTDGSSRFGPENKWGWFPSVSLGWTVSNESFYENVFGNSSSFRLRASWGLSGNNNIGNYEAFAVMSKGGYPFGNNIETAYWQGAFSDQSIGWEKTSQYNVGLDVTLLNNRISLIGNYYYSMSYDLLYDQPISAISGSTNVTTNLKDAKVRNSGIDFQVDARILTGDFKWNVSANISFNQNKVVDMGGINDIYVTSERSVVSYVTKSGLPIGSFYGYWVDGIVSEADYANILIDKLALVDGKFPDAYTPVGPAIPNYNNIHPGDVKWRDVDGDGRITEDDRDILGNAYPDFTYGFTTDFSYKGFDLQAAFSGQQGAKIINFQKYYLFGLEAYSNQLASALDRWHSDANPGSNNVHRASRASTPNISTRLSSYFVDDASYFRCTNVTLGYNFPAGWLSKIKLQAVRLYVSVDNLFTITKYEGYNPEVDYKGDNLQPGFDWGVYPLSRTYSIGVKFTF
jgi:TonB-linked SusC/RagA family outer membrane protein